MILTKEEAVRLDQQTIKEFGLSGQILMEIAGKTCAEKISALMPPNSGQVIIFCGSGNNGGDGFVIARWLTQFKHKAVIVLTDDPGKMSQETNLNYILCQKMSIQILKLSELTGKNLSMLLAHSVYIVDAILGIGFKGTVSQFLQELFNALNYSSVPKIAIDIPSGINADTGRGIHYIQAERTYTMIFPKQGLYLNEGKSASGAIEVIDIGVPVNIIHNNPPTACLIEQNNVKFPLRSNAFHKGNYGKIGIVAGSSGFSGAAIMASRACLRAGAGLITLFHPMQMEQIFSGKTPEIMTFPLVENPDGSWNCSEIMLKLSTLDVALVGPGIGTETKVRQFLRYFLKNWDKPAVLDADALNIISQEPDLLSLLADKPFVLTPHYGEFCRLAKLTMDDFREDPIKFLKDFSSKYKINVSLKSSTTVYCGKNGNSLSFIAKGNDGLATGGSGDVLAGVISSFLGQGLSLQDAACSASYLVGKTAEYLSLKRSTASIIPSDIIENLFIKESL